MRLIVTLSLVVAAACAPSAPPTRDPDISGPITRISDDRSVILVEERPYEMSGSAKVSVRIASDTRLWTPRHDRASSSSLALGAVVRVWFDGAVAESYPGQAKGGDVEIDAVSPTLYVASRGGPDVVVTVNGFVAARVPCNGGAAIRPGADGTPPLPWQLVVTRQDGRTMLDERVPALPRWVLVQRDAATMIDGSLLGPYVACP